MIKLKKGFDDSDVSEVTSALIGDQAMFTGGSVYDVLFGEEYEVDRKAKGTVFADALEKCGADKVNVSLVSGDEMFCRYCICGDDYALSIKIVDDILYASGTVIEDYVRKQSVLHDHECLLRCLQYLCKEHDLKKVSVTSNTYENDHGFDNSDAKDCGYSLSNGSNTDDILKFEWVNIFYGYPSELSRNFILRDVEILNGAIQKDMDEWYDGDDDAPDDLSVSCSMFDGSNQVEFLLPDDTVVSLWITDDTISMSSHSDEYAMDDMSAVLSNTMNYLRDICIGKQLNGVKVFAAGMLGSDSCYEDYAKDFDYKIAKKNGFDLDPMYKEEEIFTFYWYNKEREDVISEDDFDFYPVMRTHFYFQELVWIEKQMIAKIVSDNMLSKEELGEGIDGNFEDDNPAKIRVDIPTRDDHMYIRVNTQGYMVLFSGVDETELTSGILYFAELILEIRLVCMRMGLKGMFVHYATKDTLFKKGKSLANVFLNLNSEFGDFQLINSLKSKQANGYTKYVIGWNNPLRETNK